MPNMSYCRFENTFHDLLDCYNHLNDDDISESEQKYKIKIIELSHDIVDSFSDSDSDSDSD